MDPDKFGVVVIQFLNDGNEQVLHDRIIQYEQFQNGTVPVDFYHAKNKVELLDTLKLLIQKIKDEKYFFILQINAHGCEHGIAANPVPNEKEFIIWKELFYYTRKINELFNGVLMILLAVCTGNSMIGVIDPLLRAPFNFIIGSFREVNVNEAINGFREFYATPFPQIGSLDARLERMNVAVSSSKRPLFIGITAEFCFEQICNPDRDPTFFRQMVYQQVLRITNTKDMTNKLFSEVVKSVDKDIRNLLHLTHLSFKDYFLFKKK